MTEKLEKQREFNHAAMSYLRIWSKTDMGALAEIATCRKNSDAQGMGIAFYDIAKKYKVVRGISAKDTEGKELTEAGKLDRWTEIANIVQTAAEAKGRSHARVDQLSNDLNTFSSQNRTDTQDAYSLISLSSKLLWFIPSTKVKIYDSLAVKALREVGYKKNSGYEDYERCWKACMKEYRPELDMAIKELPRFLAWSCVPYDLHEKARKAIATPWFKERVFDQYLLSRATKLPPKKAKKSKESGVVEKKV